MIEALYIYLKLTNILWWLSIVAVGSVVFALLILLVWGWRR